MRNFIRAVVLTANVYFSLSFKITPIIAGENCHMTRGMQTFHHDDVEIQRNHENQLVEKLITLKMKYEKNTESRTLWAKNIVEIKSRQLTEMLKNIVLNSLVISTQITEDIQYFATWVLFGAVCKKYKGWTPHMTIVETEQSTKGSQMEILKSRFLITWTAFLFSIGKKANEAIDMAYVVQDDIDYFANALKPTNGKIDGWTPSYTIKKPMKNKQLSLQEAFGFEVLSFSTHLGKFWRKWNAMKREISSFETIKIGYVSFSSRMGKSWKNSVFYTPETISQF